MSARNSDSQCSDDAVQIVIRDRDQARAWVSPGFQDAAIAIGAIADDPRDFAEFCHAWRRYEPATDLAEKPWKTCLQNSTPAVHWIVIDLANRRLTGNHPYLPLDIMEHVPIADPANPEHSYSVRFCYPPGWEQSVGRWAEAFPPITDTEHAQPVDRRAFLLGQALAEWTATAVLKVADLPPGTPDILNHWDWPIEDRDIRNRWYDLVAKLHEQWLMTPHPGINGQHPRQLLHGGVEWIDAQVQNRQMTWSETRRRPAGLWAQSQAYRNGLFGRSGLLEYFSLCRKMIGAAFKLRIEQAIDDPVPLALQLESWQDQYLDSIDDSTGLSHRQILELDRRQMPLAIGCTEVNCACPQCSGSLESTDPEDKVHGFMMCDDTALEIDMKFAFSAWETMEEWDFEQGWMLEEST